MNILAGLFQILVGALKMGKFIRLVPQPAMVGFVNGLAIVIALAQFKFFKSSQHETLIGWQDKLIHSFSENYIMYIMVFITMAIMYFLPKITKAIPSGLVAIVSLTLLVYFTGIDTKSVGDLANISGSLPHFILPDSALLSWESLALVLPYNILA